MDFTHIHFPSSFPYASITRRFFASVLDGLVLIPVVGLLVLGFPGLLQPGQLVGPCLLQLALYLLFAAILAKWGGTPGKLALGLRVVDVETGAPITPGQATGRTFATILSGSVFLLGYLWALWSDRSLAWHDLLAGTVVVDIRPQA